MAPGTWYLIVLGLVGMACAAWLPRGLWGWLSDQTGFRLFPVGNHVGDRGLFDLTETKTKAR